MYAPYGPFFAIIPEMLPRNVAGGAMALINSMGALGLLLRLVVCRLPERRHRQPRSVLYFYGGSAFRLSMADFDC